ncbi:MAG TPA: thioredoxin domain-containing protein [Candidatus Paceibacterota bacterium]
MKNPWVIVGIITVVLFGGAIWFSSVSQKASNDGVEVSEHIKGNPESTVTLVEYSDFQCPACASFHPAVKEVIDQYGDKIRFEYKHYPLPIHSFAQQAAIAAEAAGQQGKFFEYHDMLFINQKQWSSAAAPGAFFRQYAQELGLDMEKFDRHLKSSVLRDAVRADMSEARELGLTGTPTFFLNGEKMEMESFEDFMLQIATAADPAAAAAMQASSTDSAPATNEPEIKFGL